MTESWDRLAARRVRNILRDRLVASKPMLFSKISEAGPGDQRAQPLHVSAAVDRLVRSKSVRPLALVPHSRVPLYAHQHFDPRLEQHSERLARVLAAYAAYQKASADARLSGLILEQAVFDAAVDASAFHVFGAPGTPYTGPISGIDQLRIGSGKVRSLDLVLIERSSGVLIGTEVKNLRTWMYPWSEEVWELLQKCLTVDALPLLVTRKVSFPLRMFFRLLGGLAFETNNQLFHGSLTESLADAKHTDGLGFHDIRFSPDEIRGRLRLYMSNLGTSDLRARHSQFLACKDILASYAFEEGAPVASIGKEWEDCFADLKALLVSLNRLPPRRPSG